MNMLTALTVAPAGGIDVTGTMALTGIGILLLICGVLALRELNRISNEIEGLKKELEGWERKWESVVELKTEHNMMMLQGGHKHAGLDR